MPDQTNPIRVLLVDDHDLLRTGLNLYLQNCEDIEVVGQARDGQHAVDICIDTQPDVVLMDLQMPIMNGVEATRIICERVPGAAIVALTSFGDEEMVDAAIQAGASSYILKNVSAAELADIIRDAHRGHPTLSPEATQALIRLSRQPDVQDFNLTEREFGVLNLLVKGLTNADIADALFISRSTVKKHVRGILSKLNCDNRTEAVVFAVQHHLVEIEDPEAATSN